MKVLTEGVISYRFDPTRYFEFSRFEKLAGDFLLIEGHFDFRQIPRLRGCKVVQLEFEEPNRFLTADPAFNRTEYEDYLYKVFTICPYTAEWLNRKYGNSKRTPIFFPFNERYIPPRTEKLYDVIYTGHIVSRCISDMIKEISVFNYKFVSNSDNPLVTDHGVSYFEKLRLIARSRITVVTNLLYPSALRIRDVRRIENYKKNKAFLMFSKPWSLLPFLRRTQYIVPQVKSRLFEAAFCRSLILCRRDPWNLVERFFEPNEEFVYFDPPSLRRTIRQILDDYSSYEGIIDNAYERAVNNYTTQAFFERYLRNLV